MKTRLAFGSLIGGLLVLTMVAAPVAGQTTRAPRLSDKELVALVQNAKTPADHEKLAAYYDATATEVEQKATKHRDLAAAYRRTPPVPFSSKLSNPSFPVTHCENVATSTAKEAQETRAMAEHHRMLAKGVSTER